MNTQFVQDQGPQHEGHVVHGQEHDGVCCAGGRDHSHPAHHPVQRQEGRQLLYSSQGRECQLFYLITCQFFRFLNF